MTAAALLFACGGSLTVAKGFIWGRLDWFFAGLSWLAVALLYAWTL
jgi:hypothetical protein